MGIHFGTESSPDVIRIPLVKESQSHSPLTSLIKMMLLSSCVKH